MRSLAALLVLAGACASLAPALADDRDGGDRRIVTVAFGAGLNTAQPGNVVNHHVIPATVRVDVGDIVNFAVGGFHIIRAYGDGVEVRSRGENDDRGHDHD